VTKVESAQVASDKSPVTVEFRGRDDKSVESRKSLYQQKEPAQARDRSRSIENPKRTFGDKTNMMNSTFPAKKKFCVENLKVGAPKIIEK